MMAQTMILPAALRYQAEVADGRQRHQGRRRGQRCRRPSCSRSLTRDDHRLPEGDGVAGQGPGAITPTGDAYAHAKYMPRQGAARMVESRKLGDKLETIVADDLWPLPTENPGHRQ